MNFYNMVLIGEENSGKTELLRVLADDERRKPGYFNKYHKYSNWDILNEFSDSESLEMSEGICQYSFLKRKILTTFYVVLIFLKQVQKREN
jgi:predicted ATP-dependent endonuclease of OLD family